MAHLCSASLGLPAAPRSQVKVTAGRTLSSHLLLVVARSPPWAPRAAGGVLAPPWPVQLLRTCSREHGRVHRVMCDGRQHGGVCVGGARLGCGMFTCGCAGVVCMCGGGGVWRGVCVHVEGCVHGWVCMCVHSCIAGVNAHCTAVGVALPSVAPADLVTSVVSAS